MNLIKGLKLYLFSFVFLLAGLILMPCKVYAQQQNFKPFKMIFLPDIHISFDKEDDEILYKESFVIFQDIIKNIKTLPNLDFIVFGGDLINNDDNALSDLPLFLDSIEDINFKYYAILGDREADLKESYTKQDFCAEFRRNGFKNPDLTYWAEQPTENILLIALDTSVNNKFEGNLSPEELLWLDNTLKSNPDKFTIITMHHPALPIASVDETVWKHYLLNNSNEFLNIINKYPQVKLILSGHHHNYAVNNINGKLFVSIPSIAAYPNNFKILTVYPDRIEVENRDISFKQIINKAKNILIKTKYAEEFDSKNPKNVLKFQRGDEFNKKKVFYFQEKS